MQRCAPSGRQSLCRGPSLSSCRHCWQTAEGGHSLRQHGLRTGATHTPCSGGAVVASIVFWLAAGKWLLCKPTHEHRGKTV